MPKDQAKAIRSAGNKLHCGFGFAKVCSRGGGKSTNTQTVVGGKVSRG